MLYTEPGLIWLNVDGRGGAGLNKATL